MAHDYHEARAAVHKNSSGVVRGGKCSLVDAWRTKHWETRQFVFVAAVVEANAQRWHNRMHPDARLTRSEFRERLIAGLLDNEWWREEQEEQDEEGEEEEDDDDEGEEEQQQPDEQPLKRNKPAQAPRHERVSPPKFIGRWLPATRRWKEVRTRYLDRHCVGEGCRRHTRKYCACDPSLFLCEQCFVKHREERLHQES